MKVKYIIYFLKGQYAGQAKLIEIELEEIEANGLSSYLIENGFLTVYIPSGDFSCGDYFHVKQRLVH